MPKIQAVKGTATRGFKADKLPVPKNAPPEPGLGDGSNSGAGKRGADNASGSAGNARLSGAS